MGYTHYWRAYSERIPDEAVAMVSALLSDAYSSGVVQREHDDARPPVATPEEIRFNGVGDDGHETFSFHVPDDCWLLGEEPFDFCETARKPYDDVVMKVLIVLKYYLQDRLMVTSDGSFTEEWQRARDEMRERYGISTDAGEELLAPRP